MKATITRIAFDNLFDEVGLDMITLHVFFSVDGGKELRMPFMINLESLFCFIAENDKATGKYIIGIKRGIHGYGPKDSKILGILKDEGFDIFRWIEAYFSTLEEDYIAAQVKADEEIQSPEMRKKAEQKFKNLQTIIEEFDIKNDQIKHIAFLDAVDKALHEVTFEFYPEIFEMGKKHECAYKDLLVSSVINYVESIGKIRTNQFTDRFENQYKKRLEEDF